MEKGGHLLKRQIADGLSAICNAKFSYLELSKKSLEAYAKQLHRNRNSDTGDFVSEMLNV
jgi:hypothetical protein